MELACPSPETDKTVSLRHFLASLPGAKLVDDETLPPGVSVMGCVVLLPEEQYLSLPEEKRVGKKIDFAFKQTSTGVPVAEIRREKMNAFVGLWQEAVERLVDEMAPGDHLLWRGLSEEKFFSQN
ncbi:hypothetical protein JXK06_02355 [Patescibacteria group bacterium]|nr:hypothetical protein [Patescibacteria group bacterium]